MTRRRLPLLADLREPACLDPRVAGGKGAGLARLARAGLPTLPGLVVTTAVHRAADGRAPARLRGLWDDLPGRLAALGPGPYAVRSSAFAEDGLARSWAGLLETRLAVPASGVVRAVGRVWRSAASPRAAVYDRRGPGGVAVVIQPLAAARAAGNCFTATPLRARTPLLVVEAVAGLGAPLVGGLLTPDRYLVDRRTGIVLEARPARQPWALRLRAAGRGLARGRLPAAAAGGPKLAPADVRRIARLGLAAERRLGGPQDVEWVLTGNGVALLQARPLTA